MNGDDAKKLDFTLMSEFLHAVETGSLDPGEAGYVFEIEELMADRLMNAAKQMSQTATRTGKARFFPAYHHGVSRRPRYVPSKPTSREGGRSLWGLECFLRSNRFQRQAITDCLVDGLLSRYSRNVGGFRFGGPEVATGYLQWLEPVIPVKEWTAIVDCPKGTNSTQQSRHKESWKATGVGRTKARTTKATSAATASSAATLKLMLDKRNGRDIVTTQGLLWCCYMFKVWECAQLGN